MWLQSFKKRSSQTEELGELVLLQLGADDTQPAGVVGMACPDLMLLGDEVELDPLAALAVHDALGPQDLAVVAGVQAVRIRSMSAWANTLGVSLPQEVNTSSAW